MQKKMLSLYIGLCVVTLLVSMSAYTLWGTYTSKAYSTVASESELEKSVYTNNSVYILGTLETAEALEETLLASTSTITTIDPSLLSELVAEQYILIVDGQWLEENPQTITALNNVVSKGVPVIFLNGSPKEALIATIENLPAAPTTITDADIAVAGYKYYPATGAGASLYIDGTPNDKGQNLIRLTTMMYNWGSKVLTNTPVES